MIICLENIERAKGSLYFPSDYHLSDVVAISETFKFKPTMKSQFGLGLMAQDLLRFQRRCNLNVSRNRSSTGATKSCILVIIIITMYVRTWERKPVLFMKTLNYHYVGGTLQSVKISYLIVS